MLVRSASVRTFGALLVAGAMLAAGCGGDDDDADPGDQSQPEASATTQDGSTPEPAGGGDVSASCRLTEEMVSDVLGVPMSDEGACQFYPADGEKVIPYAGYNPQIALAFNDDVLEELGYSEEVSGVGDQAYTLRDGTGTWVIVQHEGENFEVVVDTLDEERDRELAIELAKRAVAGE